MRFAIVSDIHGNLPALNAVIEDARENNINTFIFVGDYCISNPYPDECISRIRSLDNKYIIRGNEEKYLETVPEPENKSHMQPFVLSTLSTAFFTVSNILNLLPK